MGDTGALATGTGPDVSYAACEDPEQGCADADCRERVVQGAQWNVCAAPCTEDADCPPAPGSNATLVCDAEGRCAIECNPDVAVCPSGTTCVPGDPPQCMWPLDPGVASLAELCTAACEGCMAGALLGWADDCATACADDLSDCSADELATALTCPGDAECSVGGLALRSCLSALACKD